MGNITGALIENAFHPPENSDHSSDSPPLDVNEEIKRIARDSSNRELYRLLHAKMEQSALDRAAAAAVAAHHAPNLNSEAGCGDGGAGKKWESSGRRASGEEQRCGSASSGGRGSGGGVENALLSSECGSGSASADGKSGGLGSKPEQDGAREAPRMGFFKKQILKSYWTENEDTSASAATKTDPSSAAAPDGEKDAGKTGEVGGAAEVSGKDGATIAVDGRLLSNDLKAELFGDSDAAKPRTKLMNINTCIEVIVMNELKKLDSVPDDLPTGRQMPLFATLEASRTRPTENRGNELARVNAGGGNRSAVEPGWPLRSESGGRAAADAEPKREKWSQYVDVDAVPERAPTEFSPQQLMGRKTTDVAGGGTRNAPSSGYHRGGGVGYPQETTNMTQEVPRMYTSSGDNNTARNNTRLTNQFGETGVDTISHGGVSHGGGGPVVKYSPSNAWSRDISPAQSSPHVMMSGDSSGFKVMPSSSATQQQQQQLASMPMLDQRRKPERDSEPSKYQQQAEYLSYVNQQQQYHNVSNLNEQHSAAAYQNCPPVLQDKLHASDLGHYGYPTKNPRERGVHAGQFESSSSFGGNHPESLQPPLANYIKHSPKNSPILAYERDGGTARPLGPPEPQYHHRPDQPQQYHPRNDPTHQYHHRNDQTQYHRSEQLMKSQPGSLMSGSARSYRMVGDQTHPPQQQQGPPSQQPPAPQVYYRSSDRQTRAELVAAMVDKKGFPSSYQGAPTTEEYVERRMKRPSASSSSSSSGTTRGGEMGNVSVGLDHHQQQQHQQQQQQPTLRSHSISYPPRAGGGRGGGEVTEKGQWGHSSEETPLDLTVKKEFPDTQHHHPSAAYHLPPSMKQQQQQADWGAVARGVGYRPSYGGEEDPLGARLMTRATNAPQKNPDFPTMPEMQRRDMVDMRVLYDKQPSGLQQQQQQQVQHYPPESEMGRMVPAPSSAANDRTMSMRTSVIASHPFDDNPSSLAPPPLHLTMQQLSEALTKTSTQHSIGGATWKQSPYAAEMVPRSRAHTLDPEPSSRLTIDATSRQERPRPRPNNSSTANNDLLHLATTSPTIPHLSPVQPLVSTASSQAPGGTRRAPGPSLLGSHSPSDILHLQCKVCGSTYGSLRSFRMHFAKVHGLEPLPEHCNISTISGTKNAMSKAPMEDSEPPALQRETMPTDVGKNRGGFDSFGNPARPTKPDILRVEPVPTNIRTKQVAEVYPMPARTSRGLSPQLKAEGAAAASGWRTAELTELHAEQSEGQIKVGGDVKNSSRLVNCDLGIFRSRNCYSDLGCDRDTDCPECLDGFKDISDWKMHISTHMMRSCTCKPCNLSFTHSGALKKHLHAVHAHVDKVEVEYRCLFCREAFSDEKVLFYHTQEHEKRYSRLDNSRRDSISSSSLSFKAPGGSGGGGADPDCIQMAVPDTTCSDDARPTSEFGGESSSNVSPSSFPGVDSKGSGGSSTESKVDPTSCPVTLDDVSVVDKKLKTGVELELGYKQRAMLLRGGGLDSSSDHSRSSELSRLDAVAAASQLLYRSHGGIPHGLKSEDREMSGESGKLDAKFSFDIGEECRQFKPTTVTPPKAVVVKETSTFVWKKQAVLKRVQSGESRDAIDTDPNAAPPADKPSPVSSRAASSASRSSGGAGGASAEKSPSEVSQPMHLRDLFSMMGHQVEKSIWGIPDFPQFNSAPAARGSRCVRDVCDEIIALSFREESSPRDPLSAPPGSDKPENISKTKVSEQLKILVNPDHHDTRPPELLLPETRPNPEGLYGGASWTRSPCSSRDSCHSLEIDESGFNRDSAEGERLESTDSEPPRSLYGDPVVESTSPRRDYTRKESTETVEDGKHPVVEDLAKVAFGGRGHRGRDDEGSMVRHSETFYGRRPSSEGPPPSGDSAPTTMSRAKDVGSPPTSSSKQEASADGDDGKSSDSSVPTVGSKRKHVSGGGKETGDAAVVADEPPLKKSAPS